MRPGHFVSVAERVAGSRQHSRQVGPTASAGRAVGKASDSRNATPLRRRACDWRPCVPDGYAASCTGLACISGPRRTSVVGAADRVEKGRTNKPLQQTARASAALRAAPTRPQLKGVVLSGLCRSGPDRKRRRFVGMVRAPSLFEEAVQRGVGKPAMSGFREVGVCPPPMGMVSCHRRSPGVCRPRGHQGVLTGGRVPGCLARGSGAVGGTPPCQSARRGPRGSRSLSGVQAI